MAGEASPEGIIELLKIKLPFCMKLVTAHMAGCTTAILCFLALCLVSSRRVRRQAVFVLVAIAVCLAFGSAALGISAAAYEIDLHLRYDTEQPEEWYRTKQLSGASVSMAAFAILLADSTFIPKLLLYFHREDPREYKKWLWLITLPSLVKVPRIVFSAMVTQEIMTMRYDERNIHFLRLLPATIGLALFDELYATIVVAWKVIDLGWTRHHKQGRNRNLDRSIRELRKTLFLAVVCWAVPAVLMSAILVLNIIEDTHHPPCLLFLLHVVHSYAIVVSACLACVWPAIKQDQIKTASQLAERLTRVPVYKNDDDIDRDLYETSRKVSLINLDHRSHPNRASTDNKRRSHSKSLTYNLRQRHGFDRPSQFRLSYVTPTGILSDPCGRSYPPARGDARSRRVGLSQCVDHQGTEPTGMRFCKSDSGVPEPMSEDHNASGPVSRRAAISSSSQRPVVSGILKRTALLREPGQSSALSSPHPMARTSFKQSAGILRACSVDFRSQGQSSSLHKLGDVQALESPVHLTWQDEQTMASDASEIMADYEPNGGMRSTSPGCISCEAHPISGPIPLQKRWSRSSGGQHRSSDGGHEGHSQGTHNGLARDQGRLESSTQRYQHWTPEELESRHRADNRCSASPTGSLSSHFSEREATSYERTTVIERQLRPGSKTSIIRPTSNGSTLSGVRLDLETRVDIS